MKRIKCPNCPEGMMDYRARACKLCFDNYRKKHKKPRVMWRDSYGKTHYELNKQVYTQRVMDRRAKNLQYTISYKKNHPCTDCGNKDFRVLDFDHKPGTEKVDCVSKLARAGYSIENIQKEIDKCNVRCSNCHRIITYDRRMGD